MRVATRRMGSAARTGASRIGNTFSMANPMRAGGGVPRGGAFGSAAAKPPSGVFGGAVASGGSRATSRVAQAGNKIRGVASKVGSKVKGAASKAAEKLNNVSGKTAMLGAAGGLVLADSLGWDDPMNLVQDTVENTAARVVDTTANVGGNIVRVAADELGDTAEQLGGLVVDGVGAVASGAGKAVGGALDGFASMGNMLLIGLGAVVVIMVVNK